MPLNFLNILHIRGNLYLTDFFDVLIIALLIYSLFVFFRKTRTYMVFGGLAIAFGLYILSVSLGLYLTSTVLRYFVSIAVVIFVIIFQSEIRKYFEFLGLIGSRRLKVNPLSTHSITTGEIIHACVKMAQEKIGALIVIEGEDNVDNYIDGGTDLDGVISEDLLLSIFDPHSQGHDGALIIKKGRVSQFGTHLPLSTNFKEIGKKGTRHSAALGLTENVDSLCIVVSEEKGKISVCKEGRLKTLSDYSDLEKELDRYLKNKFSKVSKRTLKSFIKNNFQWKLGALLVASLLWFFTAYQAEIIEKTYKVPVNLEKLPKETVIESYSPKEISLVVKGRGESTFESINVEDFDIKLDVSKLTSGVNKVALTKKDIAIPPTLSLSYFEPELVLLTAKKYYSTMVSISVKTKGDLEEKLNLESVIVTPEKVEAWIPEDMEAPAEIQTETIDISSQTESVIIPVELVLPEGVRLLNGDSKVNVALTIGEKSEE